MKEIKITQGKIALVDDDMFEFLNQWKWVALRGKNTWYAWRSEGGHSGRKTFHMHRIIINAPEGMQVDHANGDGLDNRRENLRLCTNSQNQHNTRKRKDNTVGFKGVIKDGRKYIAVIHVEGETFRLGSFYDPKEAAHAYDEAAKKHYGDFAKTNF